MYNEFENENTNNICTQQKIEDTMIGSSLEKRGIAKKKKKR